MSANEATAPARLTMSRGEWVIAGCATATLGLLVFVPMPPPVRRFWSLFFFAEFAWPVQLLLVLLPLAAIATLRRPAAAGALRLAEAADRARASLPLAMWAVSFAAFWLLRERRHWGDAGYTVDILEGAADVGPLGRFFWKEPLDRLLAMAFTSLGRPLGLGAEGSVALLSALAGSLFVVVSWSVARRLAGSPAGRGFAFAFALAGGLSQLFFGHVENYTVVTLVMLLFLREGLAVVQGSGSLARAGLLAAVAVTTHPLAGFLIIPLAALLWLGPPGPLSRRAIRFGLAMVPGLVYLAGFYAFCRWLGAPPLAIGADRIAGTESVWLGVAEALTARHLWDVLQNYLLVLPAGAVVVLLQAAATRSESRRDRVLLLLASASLSFLVFALFLRGTLRRRRDWDLFAPAALPVALLAARLFTRRLQAGRASLGLGVFLLLFSLAVSGAWIASNYRYRPPAAREAAVLTAGAAR